MKILFITHYDNMYGANKALLRLIEGLAERDGFEPMLVIPGKGEMTNRMEQLGVPYIICGVTQWQAAYVSPLRFWAKIVMRTPKIANEVNELYNRLKDEGIDVIHSNSSVIGHGAILAGKLGCRHIWHIREFSEAHFSMKYLMPKKRVEEYYKNALKLIAISDSVKDYCFAEYPYADTVRFYDGVTIKEDCDESVSDKKADDIFRFIYVGYLYEKKHQLEVIKAFAKFSANSEKRCELYIVGDGKDDYKNKLKSSIEENHLSNVYLTGYRNDIENMLRDMDCGIIASEYEGFGLVTVEYMLASLPVIGFNHCGTAEIVKDKETGFLYLSEAELINDMKLLSEDKELSERMGKAGKKRAKELFDGDRNAEALVDFYERIRDEYSL